MASEPTNLFPDIKGKVRLKPEWLDVMIPSQWWAVSNALIAIAEEYKVPADRMRLFIRVGSQIPMPLVEAVRQFAAGEMEIEIANGDTATEPPTAQVRPAPPKLWTPKPGIN